MKLDEPPGLLDIRERAAELPDERFPDEKLRMLGARLPPEIFCPLLRGDEKLRTLGEEPERPCDRPSEEDVEPRMLGADIEPRMLGADIEPRDMEDPPRPPPREKDDPPPPRDEPPPPRKDEPPPPPPPPRTDEPPPPRPPPPPPPPPFPR